MLTITPPTQTRPARDDRHREHGVLRNVAALAPVDDTKFVRMTTIVRNNLTTTVTDDKHTTLEMVNTATGAQSVAAMMPENPVLSEFGTAPYRDAAAADGGGFTGPRYTRSRFRGLSVVPLTTTSPATAPQLATARAQ